MAATGVHGYSFMVHMCIATSIEIIFSTERPQCVRG